MNTAVDFIGLVAPGIPSSKCVRVLADDGNDWVVRPLWNESGSWGKRLFNQYVASTLALKIGLSTPEIALIDIERIRQILERIGMNSATSLGVATRYVEGLSSPLMPIDYNPVAADFPTTNRKYLTTILGDQFDFSQFYAYRVFSRWLCLEDDAWWANLYLLPSFQAVFLDFDLALGGGTSWESIPNQYDWGSMHYQAPFCEGMCIDPDQFEPWFARIQGVDEKGVTESVAMAPNGWGIPEGYIERALQLLLNRRQEFEKEFRYFLTVESDYR